MKEAKQEKTKGRALRRSPVTVYRAWCKRCGICVAFCPKKVLEADESGHPVDVRPEECVRCRLCELRCPDFAISVADEPGEKKEEPR